MSASFTPPDIGHPLFCIGAFHFIRTAHQGLLDRDLEAKWFSWGVFNFCRNQLYLDEPGLCPRPL